MSNTGKYSSMSISSLESSSDLKLSNQVIHVQELKENTDPPLPNFGLKTGTTLSPMFVKRLFSEHTLYDEAEQIQVSAAEICSSLFDIMQNESLSEKVKKNLNGAKERITLIREKVDKMLNQLTQVERNAEQKISEKLERMHLRVTHSLDREALAKQKVEQIKTKYKLKKHELKKELKAYKKHYEASKKVWAEKMKIIQKESDEFRNAKDKVLGLYLDKLSEIENEISSIMENSIISKPINSENTIKNKLFKIKENILESKNPRNWSEMESVLQKSNSSIAPPASQSASLNKAFVQSGTIGNSAVCDKEILRDDSKSANNSKLSISQYQKSFTPLNESQMKKYFGSNYTLLSVTQREKILYSIMNRSVNNESNCNDVRMEDVLNISKAGSVKATPKNNSSNNQPKNAPELFVMDDSTASIKDKNKHRELSPVFSPEEQISENIKNSELVKNQQSSVDALIETPNKFAENCQIENSNTENKKKDDTLEISFKENLNEHHIVDLNEGDTLKDLNEAINNDKSLNNHNSDDKEQQNKEGIDSLELSAIGPANVSESPIPINSGEFKPPEKSGNSNGQKMLDNLTDSIISGHHSSDNNKNTSTKQLPINNIQSKQKTFLSKTSNLRDKKAYQQQNKSFGSIPENKPLEPIKNLNLNIKKQNIENKPDNVKISETPVQKAPEKIQSPPQEPSKVLAVVGGKKVTILVKRKGNANQSADNISQSQSDISTDMHNITTIEGNNPRPMKLRLIKKSIGKPSLVFRPQNIMPNVHTPSISTVNKTMIDVSPNIGQIAPSSTKMGTPQKQKKRCSAFTIKSRPAAIPEQKMQISQNIASNTNSQRDELSRRNVNNDIQQTPEFNGKGRGMFSEESKKSEDEANDMQHIKAINNAINKIIQNQGINKNVGCQIPTVVNINIQSQTSYNTLPSNPVSAPPEQNVTKKETVITKVPLVAPMKIVRRIRSMRPTIQQQSSVNKTVIEKSAPNLNKNFEIQQIPNVKTKQNTKTTEKSSSNSPQVSIYRRKKYVRENKKPEKIFSK